MDPANGTGMDLLRGTNHENGTCDALWSDKADGNPYLYVLMMHILQHLKTYHSDSLDHDDNAAVCQMSELVQTLLNPSNSYCEDHVESWGSFPHLQDNEVAFGLLLHLHAAVIACACFDSENDDQLGLHDQHTVSCTYKHNVQLVPSTDIISVHIRLSIL